LISAPEAKVSVLDRRVLGRVGDDVNLSVVRILKHQITTLISELHAGAVERDRIDCPDPMVALIAVTRAFLSTSRQFVSV
jgi:hypothetical protein